MKKKLNLLDYDIVGNWKVKRLIFDYYNNNKYSFMGKAIISNQKKIKNSYFFKECGTLSSNQKVFNSSKTYLLNKMNDRWDILHKDNSFFFSLNLKEFKQTIYHQCCEDDYTGDFKITSANSFTITWSVIGPYKTYYSKTIYKKHLQDK